MGPYFVIKLLFHTQIEVIRLITNGFRNMMIADATHIALDTVKTHVRHIFQKLDVQIRLQAVTRIKDFGILPCHIDFSDTSKVILQ